MTGSDLFLILIGCLAGAGIDIAASRLASKAGSIPQRAQPGFSTLPCAIAGALIGLTAGLFAAGDMIPAFLTCAFGLLLLALAAIDLRLFILPDGLNLAVFLLGGAMVALLRPESWAWHISGAALGYGLLWLVEAGYRRLRHREGLGRGDAKLLGAVGIWVGVTGIPPVLLIASISGILAVLIQAGLKRQSISAQTAIAFGPWIALGGYCVWLLPALAPRFL